MVPGASPKTPVWHIDAARGPSTPSLDHLVGTAEQWERYGEAERPGGLHVNDQLDLSGLLHRQIARLLALKNSPGVGADQTVVFRFVAAVAEQAAGRCERTKLEDRGNGVAQR